MKTYLKVLFHAEGSKPSIVVAALGNLGFSPAKGAHDFIYEWPTNASVDEVLAFADRIHQELSGSRCLFEMETF